MARRTPDRIDGQVARLRMLAAINPAGAIELAIELVERERIHRALEYGSDPLRRREWQLRRRAH